MTNHRCYFNCAFPLCADASSSEVVRKITVGNFTIVKLYFYEEQCIRIISKITSLCLYFGCLLFLKFYFTIIWRNNVNVKQFSCSKSGVIDWLYVWLLILFYQKRSLSSCSQSQLYGCLVACKINCCSYNGLSCWNQCACCGANASDIRTCKSCCDATSQLLRALFEMHY